MITAQRVQLSEHVCPLKQALMFTFTFLITLLVISRALSLGIGSLSGFEGLQHMIGARLLPGIGLIAAKGLCSMKSNLLPWVLTARWMDAMALLCNSAVQIYTCAESIEERKCVAHISTQPPSNKLMMQNSFHDLLLCMQQWHAPSPKPTEAIAESQL